MKKKILVVDDDDNHRYLLKCLLESKGLEVATAENGREALTAAHADRPDLILSDILMPVMDGYTLCRQLKSDAQLKHIPFLFYTASYAEPQDEAFALSLGADRFILKPQEPDSLMNILNEVLEKSPAAKRSAVQPLHEEKEFLRQYNEILFSKLEEKILDLEATNQNLRLLEERYRLSFEHVKDVVCTIDANLNFLNVSPSIEQLLGYRPSDFIGHPVSEFKKILTPDSFRSALTALRTALQGNDTPESIYQFIAKDGTIKHGEASASSVMRGGKIIGIIAVVRDITERKRAEEKLSESEEAYRTLFQDTSNPILVIDHDGNYIGGNQAALQFLESTEEQLLSKNVGDTLPPGGDAAGVLNGLQSLWESGGRIEREYFVGGKIKVLDLTITPGVWYGRRSIFGLGTDITNRKQAEEALRQTEENYRRSMDDSPLGIRILSDDGEPLYANRAFLDIHGYDSLEEYEKIPAANHYTPESYTEVERRSEQRKRGDDGSTEYEINIVRKDGEVRHLKIFRKRILWNGERRSQSIYQDITEKKQTEDALRASEHRFRHLFEQMSSAVAVYEAVDNGADFVFRDFNRSAERLEKIGRENVLGRRVTEVFPGVRDFGIYAVFQRVWETGLPEDFDTSFYQDDRISGWRENHVYKLPTGEIVAIYDDVTARKQMEEIMRLQQNRLDLAQSAGKVGVFDQDLVNDRSTWTPQLEIIYGLEPGSVEHTHKNWAARVHPDDLGKAESKIEQCIHERLSEWEADYRIVRPDGEVRWLSGRAHIFYDASEKPLRMVGTIVDITERKRAEEALAESEKKHRFITEKMRDIVWIMDMNLRTVYVSPSITTMLGFTVAERIAQDVHEQLTPASLSAAQEMMAKELALEQQGQADPDRTIVIALEYYHKDGSTRWVENIISGIRDDQGALTGLHGVSRDITERKQVERDLQEARDQLLQSEKLAAIGRLSAGVAHEILNPLNIISMELQMWQAMESLPPSMAEELKVCTAQVSRIANITENLKQFSRIPPKRIVLADINDTIAHVLSLYAPQLKLEEIKAEVQYQPDLPAIAMDWEKIEQLILNLISNAAAAMEGKKNKRLHIRTERETVPGDRDRLKITVADTGTGIKSEHLSKIFDPFFTTKEPGKGTGLGLSISYGIVQDHGGTIWAVNNKRQGASFYVRLPLKTSL